MGRFGLPSGELGTDRLPSLKVVCLSLDSGRSCLDDESTNSSGHSPRSQDER